MRFLFDDIVAKIKRILPNSLISWDIRPSLSKSSMKTWWSYFKNSSDIDFINTSGAKSHGNSSSISGAGNELTWAFMSSLTGKKIIADNGMIILKLYVKFSKI